MRSSFNLEKEATQKNLEERISLQNKLLSFEEQLSSENGGKESGWKEEMEADERALKLLCPGKLAKRQHCGAMQIDGSIQVLRQ